MQEFFHADTRIYKKRCRFWLILINAPLAMVGILGILVLLMNFRLLSDESYVFSVLMLVLGVVFTGMNISWLIYEITCYFVRRQGRYTFVDIGIKEIVFSQYAGQYHHLGAKITRRRLYVIPLESVDKICYKPNKKQVSIDGKFKLYQMDSRRLGYHIKKGKVDFDNWWLMENSFAEIHNITFPKLFSRPKYLAKCILVAKKRLKYMPKPRKFEIKNPVVYRRPVSDRRKRYSNFAELPTYNRKW